MSPYWFLIFFLIYTADMHAVADIKKTRHFNLDPSLSELNGYKSHPFIIQLQSLKVFVLKSPENIVVFKCSFLPVHEYWVVGCCLCPQMFSCSSPATIGLGGQEWAIHKTGDKKTKQHIRIRGGKEDCNRGNIRAFFSLLVICIYICVCI